MGQSPKPEYTPFSIPFWKKAGLGVVFSRKSPYHKTKGRMVDKTMDYTAGIDVGGTKVALGVFGEDKTLLGKAKYPSDPALSAQDFFRQTVDTLRQLMEGLSLPWENLKGVGVGAVSYTHLHIPGGKHRLHRAALWKNAFAEAYKKEFFCIVWKNLPKKEDSPPGPAPPGKSPIFPAFLFEISKELCYNVSKVCLSPGEYPGPVSYTHLTRSTCPAPTRNGSATRSRT